MKVLNTHRKCMICKNTTTDLTIEKCGCGAYMYVIGQYYTLNVQKNNSTLNPGRLGAVSFTNKVIAMK